MSARTFRRREFLATSALATLALAACASGAGRLGAVDAGSHAALTRMARLLYPHDALGDEVYAEVVSGVVASGDAAALSDGVRSLDAAGPVRFLDRDEAGQLAALRAIEGGAFFAAMRTGVQGGLYEHPATWELIGYPGSALPFGGYWDKGFDDIDWLEDA